MYKWSMSGQLTDKPYLLLPRLSVMRAFLRLVLMRVVFLTPRKWLKMSLMFCLISLTVLGYSYRSLDVLAGVLFLSVCHCWVLSCVLV